MTRIVIQPLTVANQADLNRCENSFTVEAELCLHAEDGRISYTVRPVTPYVKHYGPEVYDAQAYISRPEHAAWLAYVDGQLAGQILVHENPGLSQDEGWNRFAIIWDIAVAQPYRRQGAGRRLIAKHPSGSSRRSRGHGAAGCPAYDRILIAYCCEPAATSVLGASSRYTFWGERNDERYMVEVSAS